MSFMDSALLGVAFGLASATGWGAADFYGGIASKRSSAFGVVILSQLVGFVLLAGLAALLQEPFPSPTNIAWAAATGVSSGISMVTMYRALAIGRMGIVAPVSAVVAVIVPVLFGIVGEGIPSAHKLLGFGLAVLSIWLVSQRRGERGVEWVSLGLAVLSGLAGGIVLVLINHVSDDAVLWPLAGMRLTSVAMLLLATSIARVRWRPNVDQFPIIGMTGAVGVLGPLFYALSTRAGRLDVAAVLASFYPAVTILMARFMLTEQVSVRQWLGLGVAIAAIVLIAL